MEYPTEELVKAASHEQLARWYRFLGSPTNPEQVKVMDLIVLRFTELGGWNPTLSKKIGWRD